jgi:methylenetetrahydrofolate reductase (NADPH)
LKQKQDNGASAAITQFFFDNDDFLRYRDKATALGVTIPIIPGIMVPENIAGVSRFAKACGASIPPSLVSRMSGIESDEATRRLVATHFSIQQCEALAAEGVNQFHFYTLNRSESTYAICHALGLRSSLSEAA